MQHCNRIVLGLSVFIAVALAAVSTPAHAAKGEWSIGGNFGVGMYSNTAINDSLDRIFASSGVSPKHVKSGWEYGGSIRYGISPKASLDYEVNLLNGKATTDADATAGTPEFTAKTTGIAGPLSLYINLSSNDKDDIDFFIGAGPMYSTKWKFEVKGSSPTTLEAKSKTGLYAHLGFEAEHHLSKSLSISARALGRYAKASDVTYTDPTDPSVQYKADVNLSGAAFAIGLREHFGKH
jgi:hypothetical protein